MYAVVIRPSIEYGGDIWEGAGLESIILGEPRGFWFFCLRLVRGDMGLESLRGRIMYRYYMYIL